MTSWLFRKVSENWVQRNHIMPPPFVHVDSSRGLSRYDNFCWGGKMTPENFSDAAVRSKTIKKVKGLHEHLGNFEGDCGSVKSTMHLKIWTLFFNTQACVWETRGWDGHEEKWLRRPSFAAHTVLCCYMMSTRCAMICCTKTHASNIQLYRAFLQWIFLVLLTGSEK